MNTLTHPRDARYPRQDTPLARREARIRAPLGVVHNLVLPPASPRRLADTGLDEQMLIELVAKVFYLRGSLRLIDLVQHVRLPSVLLEEILRFLRGERVIDLLRRGASVGDVDYRLTENGRARAAEYLRKCHYAGAAPVSLSDYAAQVRRQSIAELRINQDDIEDAYRDIVVSSEFRDLIGAAMNSNRSMFFYGPSGSGKTFLAESLVRLLHGTIYVPHALAVSGEIIQLFDPLIHRADDNEVAHRALDNRSRVDQRWVPCARPVAISGGELTIDMLDLQYDPITGFYQAPAHVKANNGIYIIDDLGRQLVRPDQLMNRWIVPMDRRRDYLNLHNGSSFEIPFDVKLVFSTNLTPDAVADEAFLRRLGYKIHVGAVSESKYEQIFRQVCVEFGVEYDADAFESLLSLHHRTNRPTLACYPRDLIAQMGNDAAYRECPLKLSPQLVDWAWHSYFASQ